MYKNIQNFLLIEIICCLSSLSFASIDINNLSISKSTISTYDTFEIHFSLSSTFTNPFNPDEIDIEGIISQSDYSNQTCYGFWYQPFSISSGINSQEYYSSTGNPFWMIRYTPNRTGNYLISIKVNSVYGFTSSTCIHFNVQPSSKPGFIRLHPDNRRFFQYENGITYYPLGHNVSGSSFYTHPSLDGITAARFYYPRLSDNKINWARFWLTNTYKNAIEWTGNNYPGIGLYSLAKAYRTDQIMDIAGENNVNIQFTLNDFRNVSNWADIYWPFSPYNSLNGGPVPNSSPQDFFSNSTAKSLFKRYLRYCIARWGHLPNIFAWELFNEVEYTCDTQQNIFTNTTIKNNVVQWHQEMAQYIKANDPYKHLITTSSDDPWYPNVGYRNYSLFSSLWSLPEIDIIQTHIYTFNLENDINYECQLFKKLFPYKAHMIGEFGIQKAPEYNNSTTEYTGEDGFDPTTFCGTTVQKDHLIEGTHFHNSLWTALMNESMAGLWWWDSYLESDSTKHRLSPQFPLYYHYPPIDNFMKITLHPGLIPYEDWPHYNLSPADLEVSSNIKAIGLSNTERCYIWFRDIQNDYFYDSEPGDMVNRNISGEFIIIKGLIPNTKYTLQYFDTYNSGGPISPAINFFSSTGGNLTIKIPDFQRDLAVKIVKTDVITAINDNIWKYWDLSTDY